MNIRQIEPRDYSLLPDFLYHAIFYRKSLANSLSREIIYRPEIFVYINGFGCEGDCGVVAEVGSKIFGIAWARIIRAFGYVDSKTPELAMSVLPEYRGQGIGTKLLKILLELLREKGYEQISLSVQKGNPALRLYRHFGCKVIRQSNSELVMTKDLVH